ncbi:MAG: hypothetical protein H7328_01305 [Bdellovibrio sp.]|nr:hypothetical protein [Bdellovibrio sp.]
MVLIKRSFTQLKQLFLDMKVTWKETGIKGLYKRYGWKLFLGFFTYYLIRDSLIYLIIPWLIAKHLIN